MNMKLKYYDSFAAFSGHVRCYTCNKFGHAAKECRNKSMDFYRQQGKKPDKNIVTKIPEKYESTSTSHIKQKEEEKKVCPFFFLI